MTAPYQTLGANRYAGPAAELPAANQFPAGAEYYAVDTNTLYVTDGTTWHAH
ncbi:MAG: hypothetical protein WAM97_08730 [Acidimicrobiales bacterium]